MTGWAGNLQHATIENRTFRTVLGTATQLQLVVMHLEPGEEIGLEMHDDIDQFIRVEEGAATVTLGPTEEIVEQTIALADEWAVIVPAGTWHNVVNVGHGPLKLYTVYAPPEHLDGTVHETKADAEAEAHHH